jgi:hypothetical protein
MAHSKTIIDGVEYPSVTEIIGIISKPFLARWRGKIGNAKADQVSRESADIGNQVHACIDKFLKGEMVTFCGADEHVKPPFVAWFDWWRASKYTCAEQEIKVISKKHKYGGTFDAVLTNADSEPILVDWKISNNDDRVRWLQLAGYAQAYLEQTGTKIKRGMIVRIDKKQKVHIKEVKNLFKFVPLFLACRKVWNFVNQKGSFKKVK